MAVIKTNEQIPRDHFAGGSNLDNNEELRDILNRLKTTAARAGGPRITQAQMTALGPNDRWDGMVVCVGGNFWYWHNTTALAADGLMVIDADDKPALGAWLLAPGQVGRVSMPASAALADAAALLTVPTGGLIIPLEFWWTITTNWTGGSSSTIGVSTDVTSHNTKGDLLGGAAGDDAAALTTALSPTFGTIGTVWATAANRRLMVPAGKIIRYDEITSAFTAGEGTVEMLAHIVANAGA